MFAVFGLGPQEIVLLAVVGVLLFGRKLPEIARYLGKSFVEFRNGMRGVEEQIEGAVAARPEPPPEPLRPPQRLAAAAPQFEVHS
jgi:sec-independent protein translocase protein TatA